MTVQHDFKVGQSLWCGNELYASGLIRSGYVIRKIQDVNMIAGLERSGEEDYIDLDTMASMYRPHLHFGTTEAHVAKKIAEVRHAKKLWRAKELTLEEVEYEVSFWTQQLRRRK